MCHSLFTMCEGAPDGTLDKDEVGQGLGDWPMEATVLIARFTDQGAEPQKSATEYASVHYHAITFCFNVYCLIHEKGRHDYPFAWRKKEILPMAFIHCYCT